MQKNFEFLYHKICLGILNKPGTLEENVRIMKQVTMLLACYKC